MRFEHDSVTGSGTAQAAYLLASLCMVPMLAVADAAAVSDDDDGPCTRTAEVAFVACGHEVSDDYFLTLAKCANESDDAGRQRCNRVAGITRDEAREECFAVREARDDFCDDFGQGRYDPVIDPAQFVDPGAIGGAVAPNPYFPLVPGSRWTYVDGDGTAVVHVTGETREILGVTCAVVRDTVVEDGERVEDTDDYFAQDMLGNVWYFGEISQNFEDGELVDIEGSWLAGEELAKPGIAFEAAPQVGDFYRQEFALGEAEDAAEVLSTTASATVPAASCNGSCVLTEDFNLLEPDSLENKYYAPGVGFILETDPETGERSVELIDYQIGE